MASSSFLDRLSSPRNRSPLLPLNSPLRRSPSEYQLDELDPHPHDESPQDDVPRPRLRRAAAPEKLRDDSPVSWSGRGSSVGSSSKRKSRPMFTGPPPPITSSVMTSTNSSPAGSRRRPVSSTQRGLLEHSRLNIGSLLLSHPSEQTAQNSDSVWRGIRRQEKSIERDIQELLDVQAAGLVAGSTGIDSTGSDVDGYSDAGSGSTPTGTFYSTATSKSRMMSSLYVPARSTPDGNVIPVRQPVSGRPRGLKASRTGLRKCMVALVNLKQEEDAHIDAALSQRKQALVHLERLAARSSGIRAELQALEEDEEEPMGKELRELGTKHDALDEEIRLLEEKLVGMRNRRRWLREKMSDVKNKREAGLSGYRGALKDVDSDVATLLHRPPIQPLDPEMLTPSDASEVEAAGADFVRLIPERRTVDLARSWWRGEITILERRKSQISSDRDALEEGGAMWNEALALVTEFETALRTLLKTGTTPPSPPSGSSKGKDKVPSQEELIRDQLPKMDRVIAELEERMQIAESKQWNLLICAIGAELEAFKEAQAMLKIVAEPPEVDEHQNKTADQEDDGSNETGGQETLGRHGEDSDNEVPPDLLVSRMEDAESRNASQQSRSVEGAHASLPGGESEDEVPPEFLQQHE